MNMELFTIAFDLVVSLIKRSSQIFMLKTPPENAKASVGILMLDTQFPRILGDVGNRDTWPFPVEYKIVAGASPDAVVRNDPLKLMDVFVEAGLELIKNGAW